MSDLNRLKTEDQSSYVNAINEIVGKRIIANAIGEPLNSLDKWSDMESDINSLLSTFKTNMMNNGVTVESGDRFKSLIDKIATLADSEGKGVQFASGVTENVYGSQVNDPSNLSINVPINLDFEPTYFLICIPKIQGRMGWASYTNLLLSNFANSQTQNAYGGGGTHTLKVTMSNITTSNFLLTIYSSASGSTYGAAAEINCQITWYAIGVGEDDTTLLDSLKSILAEEGVTTTEEDDMASLITKVDNEFNDKNNEINDMKQDLVDALANKGIVVGTDKTYDELISDLLVYEINIGDVKQIACGGSYTFILKNDGSIWACGYNNYGGINGSMFTHITNDVKQIACGGNHTFILKNDGSLWACGDNSSGQLGLGDTTNRSGFIQVTTNINNDVKQIACGEKHTMVVKNDGSLWACGYNGGINYYSPLGLGDTTNRTTFTQVTTNINNDVKEVICGENQSFIIKNDGTLWGTGENRGELGTGSSVGNLYVFTKITSNVSNIQQISTAATQTMMLKTDGSLWATGYDGYGALGLNDKTTKFTFTKVTTNVNNDVKQVACGGYDVYGYTFILKNDGSVWSCGYNNYGQLGLGDTTTYYTFTRIPNVSNIKQIVCSSGGYHVLLLTESGNILSCGNNGNGQLGLGIDEGYGRIFNKVTFNI